MLGEGGCHIGHGRGVEHLADDLVFLGGDQTGFAVAGAPGGWRRTPPAG